MLTPVSTLSAPVTIAGRISEATAIPTEFAILDALVSLLQMILKPLTDTSNHTSCTSSTSTKP